MSSKVKKFKKLSPSDKAKIAKYMKAHPRADKRAITARVMLGRPI